MRDAHYCDQGYVGPLVLKSHIFVWWIELGLGMMFTSVHHSGYHLPFLPSPEFHDYHHLTYVQIHFIRYVL